MRIFGGKDYYDSALSMGIDPTIVMVREKSKSVLPKDVGFSLPDRCARIWHKEGRYMRQQPSKSFGVAFCGKVYQGVEVQRRYTTKPEYFWSAEKLREWANKEKGWDADVDHKWSERKPQSLAEWFAPKDAPQVMREYMIRNKVAILVGTGEGTWRDEKTPLQVNPIGLKQIGFAKALDPYTAFQELSMWIGGILGGTSPEIVRITDDKVLIENHGYDKHSFRSSTRAA